jgi:hypothetical protein
MRIGWSLAVLLAAAHYAHATCTDQLCDVCTCSSAATVADCASRGLTRIPCVNATVKFLDLSNNTLVLTPTPFADAPNLQSL